MKNYARYELWAEAEPGSEQFYFSLGFQSKIPHYERFVLQGGNSQQQPNYDSSDLPDFYSYIYGEEIHDRKYLQVLLKSLLDYQPIFELHDPIRITNVGPDLQIIDRALPSIPTKRSLFISSSSVLSDIQVEETLTKYIELQPNSIDYYITTLGPKIHNWRKYSTIDRLHKSVVS